MVGSKQPTPVFLSPDEAENHCKKGATVWEFASTEKGNNPDAVIVGIGTELTFEVVKAAEIIRRIAPELRLRVVNVTDLMILGTEGSHPHAFTGRGFDNLFTKDKPIHFNYHGYAAELKGLLFDRPQMDRITVASYKEEGSTTTPFHMMLLNEVSRYHVAMHSLKGAARVNESIKDKLYSHLKTLEKEVSDITDYIMKESKGKFIIRLNSILCLNPNTA